jgi:hypothetical protein
MGLRMGLRMGSGPFRNSAARHAELGTLLGGVCCVGSRDFCNALLQRRTYFRTSLLMIVFMISLVPP